MSTTTPKTDEDHTCHDLQNIRYKTMMLSGKSKKIAPKCGSDSTDEIDKMLEAERKATRNVTWSRLDRSSRVVKLRQYADKVGKEKDMTRKEIISLQEYLVTSMQRKKRLIRSKEVRYNKETQEIESIPSLHYVNESRKFTLKRAERRQSTLSSLGSGSDTSRKRKPKKKNDKIESGIKIIPEAV